MKNTFVGIFLVAVIASGLIFHLAGVSSDLKLSLEQMGGLVFNQHIAEHAVLNAPNESRNIARQFSTTARTMSVRALYSVVRNYVQSDNFRKRYDSWLRSKYRVENGDEVPEAASMQVLKAAQDTHLTQVLRVSPT